MVATLQAWILTVMIALVPAAPWRASYEGTALALAREAVDAPLYAGADGPAETAALLVALARFESNFDPHAVGDHGAAIGLFQVHRENLLLPASMVLDAVDLQAREAQRMIALSFRVCRGKAADELLGWYAAGGAGCARRLVESRHRMGLARRLLREHPFALPAVAAAE